MKLLNNIVVFIVTSSPFVAADISFIRSLLRRNNDQEEDKLFMPSEKKCSDPHKLMPACKKIIPGLEATKSGGYQFSEETSNMRKFFFDQAAKRNMCGTCSANKNLNTRTFRRRQEYAGQFLDIIKPKKVLDISPYSNPIHAFMKHCPGSVFAIEPCGELAHNGDDAWSSEEVSCGDGSKSIHNGIPQKADTFIHSPHLEHFDAVVCIGCDKYHGSTWKDPMS